MFDMGRSSGKVQATHDGRKTRNSSIGSEWLESHKNSNGGGGCNLVDSDGVDPIFILIR